MQNLRSLSPFKVAFLATLLLGAAARPARAQAIGFVIGYSNTTINGGPTASTVATSGYSGSILGISVGSDDRKPVSFAAEALFATKGVQVFQPNVSKIIRLRYFEVPVLARVRIAKIGRGSSAHLLAGPSFAYRVGAADLSSTADIGSQVKKFDAGFQFGGGVTFNGVLLEARYEWGLVNIANGAGVMGTGTMKNRALHLAVVAHIR
jgi:hypothetical protein